MQSLEIQPDRCTGCKQCELACSWVQTGSFQPSRSLIRVHIFDEQASFAPYTCFQCSEAWCMQACPTNAIDIDATSGAKVVIDDACVGCKLCVIACPFGTMFFEQQAEVASKCDLCAGDPACVKSCPTNAIEYCEVESGTWLAPFAEKVDRD
ncbi:MAG: (Fe-S)-binding protein, partial [Deltaproteobacteria bacterium]|nr:(Fe-S)-binding protein [Deltaproteobacteria bacterium]